MRKASSLRSLALLALSFIAFAPADGASEPVNVTQFHNHASRDGIFVDGAFTRAAAAQLKRDPAFDGAISGHVYAQPLYLDRGPGGKPSVIAATESNNVYALDAISGKVIWQRNVGAPVAKSNLPCGNIDPLGITGTPVIDLPSRALFFDAMTTPDGGKTKQHLIFALDLDTGAVRPGWPVDVSGTASFNGVPFKSAVQNQRAALAIMGNILYVAYGGHYGDCAGYHGWVVGVPIAKPETVKAWCTQAKGGGIWGVGGIANDGKDIFVVTGNTFDTGGTWGGGNSVFRLHPGPVFSGNTADYWGPTNWYDLDKGDNDMGGSGAILLDVPGANPSELVLTLGKDAKAYLLDRARLGGITEALATESVSRNSIIQAATTYRTDRGIHVVFRGSERTVQSLRIEAARPPKIVMDWSVTQHGKGSPFVTMSDGKNDLLVWSLGAEGDQRLHAYDGDTGEVVYDGGGEGELMTGTRRFSTGIVARGRIYVAADEKVYAFVPATAK